MPRHTRSLSFWLVPNLSLAATIAAAFYLLFIFFAPLNFYLDADPGWHIRAGEWMLDQGRMPEPEPFSWVTLETKWYAWEWLAEVVMGYVYRLDGLPGITLLFSVLLLGITWLWFAIQFWLGGSFLLTCVFAAMLVSLTQLHWLARPHVFGFLFVLIALVYFEKQPRFDWRQAVIAFLFGSLWANIHPSFFLPVLMGSCYLLSREFPRWDRLLWLAFYAAGTFANPYGPGLHLHLLDFLTNPKYRENIQEWGSYSYDAAQPVLVLPAILCCAAGAIAAVLQRRLHHGAVIGLFLLLALTSTRNLALLGLVGLPFSNVALTRAIAGLRSGWARRWTALSKELGALDREFGGYVLVPLALIFIFLYLHRPAIAARTGFAVDRFPVKAAERLRDADPNARILTNVVEGGYLIWHFEGKRKVFIDGRGDYLGLGPYQRGFEIMRGAPGWEEQLKQLGFTHALLRKEIPLARALRERGWDVLHEDEHYVVLQRPFS